MFLGRFDPSAIDPRLLFNRQEDLDWLVEAISDYLRDPDPSARGALSFCIVGEKGVGKTILTRAALLRLRQDFSDRAIFVEADCRYFHRAKDVIDVLARSVVLQLDEFRRLEPKRVPDELMATAQTLAAITRFEEAELKVVREHLEQFKAALNLKGEHSLLNQLKLDFQIEIERSSSTSREFSGKVRFDEMRLCRALGALFEDIRRSGIDVVVYIDNMDELSHHYRTEAEREKARHDTDALLLLRDARVVFIVNMRTYYLGILPREMTNRRILRRLAEDELHGILRKRLESLKPEIKKAADTPNAKKLLARLAKAAPTPLAFLIWFKVLFEAGALSEEKLEAGVTSFLETYYATLPASVMRSVIKAFQPPEIAIDREALLGACGKNEAALRQVVDRQGVLPKDFWDPSTYYTLDPELQIAHPGALSMDPGAKS